MFQRKRKRKNVYIHINMGTGSTVLKNTVEIQDKKSCKGIVIISRRARLP